MTPTRSTRAVNLIRHDTDVYIVVPKGSPLNPENDSTNREHNLASASFYSLLNPEHPKNKFLSFRRYRHHSVRNLL